MIRKGANQAGGSALTGDWQPLQAAAKPEPEPEPEPAPATTSQEAPHRLVTHTCMSALLALTSIHIVVIQVIKWCLMRSHACSLMQPKLSCARHALGHTTSSHTCPCPSVVFLTPHKHVKQGTQPVIDFVHLQLALLWSQQP